MAEQTNWLSLLVDVVDRYEGSVIADPRQLCADGRDVAEDWLRCGWPATGIELVRLLDSHAAELLAMGLLVHHTKAGPGQPEWIAVTDLDAPPRPLVRLAAASLVPTPVNHGPTRGIGWPTKWKTRAET